MTPGGRSNVVRALATASPLTLREKNSVANLPQKFRFAWKAQCFARYCAGDVAGEYGDRPREIADAAPLRTA
jgi:hypothetical protein